MSFSQTHIFMVLLHDSVIVVLAVSKVLLKEARESLPQHIADLYGNVDKLFMGKAFSIFPNVPRMGKLDQMCREILACLSVNSHPGSKSQALFHASGLSSVLTNTCG